MTQQRILQFSDMDSPRRAKRVARRKAIIEIVCILALGWFASEMAVGCIEWASVMLAGR